MKEYLIEWQAGITKGRSWVKAESVVAAKVATRSEIDSLKLTGGIVRLAHTDTK